MQGPLRRSPPRKPITVGPVGDSFEVCQFGFVGTGNWRCANLDFTLGETIAGRNYLDLALPVLRADDQQRQATKRGSMVSMKRLDGGSITIIHRLDFSGAGYAEVD